MTTAAHRNGHAAPRPRFTGAFIWYSRDRQFYRLARWAEPGLGTVWYPMREGAYRDVNFQPTDDRARATGFRTHQDVKDWIDDRAKAAEGGYGSTPPPPAPSQADAEPQPIPVPRPPLIPQPEREPEPARMWFQAGGLRFLLSEFRREDAGFAGAAEPVWHVSLDEGELSYQDLCPERDDLSLEFRSRYTATFRSAHEAQEAIERYLERRRRPALAARLREAADRVERGELGVVIGRGEPGEPTWTATFREFARAGAQGPVRLDRADNTGR